MTAYEWATERGIVELTGGRFVIVKWGDTLLGKETKGAIQFYEHRPVTYH